MSAALIEEIVALPSIRRVCATRPDLFEDALQEARIAIWEALEKRPGLERGYYVKAARYGALNLLLGRAATGAPHRGHYRRKEPTYLASLDDTFEDGSLRYEVADPTAEDALDRVEIEADFPRLRAVVACLSERDQLIVRRLFWDELTYEELGDELGITGSGVGKAWRSRIRPQLVELLSLYE